MTAGSGYGWFLELSLMIIQHELSQLRAEDGVLEHFFQKKYNCSAVIVPDRSWDLRSYLSGVLVRTMT